MKFWLLVPKHCRCPNTVGVQTLWVPKHCGCPNTVGAQTLWVPKHCGCPNTVGVQTLCVPQHSYIIWIYLEVMEHKYIIPQHAVSILS
jgi:hypothetical protein